MNMNVSAVYRQQSNDTICITIRDRTEFHLRRI